MLLEVKGVRKLPFYFASILDILKHLQYSICMKIKYFLFISFIFLPVFSASAEAKPKVESSRLTLTIGNVKEAVPTNIYSSWFTHESRLKFVPDYKSEIENIEFCPFGDKIVCSLAIGNLKKNHLKKESTTTLNSGLVKQYVEDLAKRTDSEPVDATFKLENGKVSAFTPEQDGIKLEIDKSVEEIVNKINDFPSTKDSVEISLAYKTIKPSVSAGEINNIGISTLIGQGKSNFKGSPSNRVHNIKVAVSKFNGVLIKPGEEFSFVKILGDVDGENGYLPELVIKNNKTEPEFGGGICQVSTTVFRAAIYSGLKITTRRNHAYPVGYYNPQGMDATIYIPSPDLRFINNTPGYILIQGRINGTELIFDFYGTDDGRKVEIDGPRITESNPDKSIKTTFSQKVTDKDGNVVINETFNSTYASPYKYPHQGEVMLAAKPSNWSDAEWEAYKNSYKAANPPASKRKKK